MNNYSDFTVGGKRILMELPSGLPIHEVMWLLDQSEVPVFIDTEREAVFRQTMILGRVAETTGVETAIRRVLSLSADESSIDEQTAIEVLHRSLMNGNPNKEVCQLLDEALVLGGYLPLPDSKTNNGKGKGKGHSASLGVYTERCRVKNYLRLRGLTQEAIEEFLDETDSKEDN